MAKQPLQPEHQLGVLRNAAKLTDSLVGVQAAARQMIPVPGGFGREFDAPALHRLLIGPPGRFEQRFGNQPGQDDVASFGPMTAECGLLSRQRLGLPGPIIAIKPRLRSGVREVFGAIGGQPGEIHGQFGNPMPGEGAKNRVHQRHLFEDTA